MTLLAARPMTPCRPRLTRSLGVYEQAGWSVKLVGITASDDPPGDPVLALLWRMKTGSLAPRAGCAEVGAPGFSDMTWGLRAGERGVVTRTVRRGMTASDAGSRWPG
jgi:hypothetical protein